MTQHQLKELREEAYRLSVRNPNPDDVADYMQIVSACARMESRRAHEVVFLQSVTERAAAKAADLAAATALEGALATPPEDDPKP